MILAALAPAAAHPLHFVVSYQTGEATTGDVSQALARMWDNLDGEPRERISRGLAMLALAERVRPVQGEAMDEWPTELDVVSSDRYCKHLRLPTLPDGLRFRRTSKWNEGVLELQPPPDAVLQPFYGRRGWRPPDFSLSFAQQVRRLLRGDRD